MLRICQLQKGELFFGLENIRANHKNNIDYIRKCRKYERGSNEGTVINKQNYTSILLDIISLDKLWNKKI